MSSSLAHFTGFTKVIEIENPRKLYEIKTEKELIDCSWYDIYPENSSDEAKHPKGYNKGARILLDSMDVMILASFYRNKRLYHIYCDEKQTSIAYIDSNKLIPVQKIYNAPLYFSNVRNLKGNTNIFPIRTRNFRGVILLNTKKLRIIKFRR